MFNVIKREAKVAAYVVRRAAKAAEKVAKAFRIVGWRADGDRRVQHERIV